MADQSSKGRNADAHPYVLIAMANTVRAAALRTAALDVADDVVLAADGAAATQLISRRGAPRLLIADLSLPTLDGFALVRHLRQTAPKARTAVIAVSAHDALRAAARDLAESLGIAKVLRLDADRPTLRAAISAAYAEVTDTRPPPPARPEEPARAASSEEGGYDDLLHNALFAIVRHFEVPIVGALVKVNEQERFVAYASVPNPANLFNGSTAWNTLPQVAATGEPLVVPDVEGHPVFGDVTGTGSAVRGFASVPIVSPQGTSWGALCVVDTRPLSLDAAAIEALTTQTQEIARGLDEIFGVAQHSAASFQALEQLAATDPLTGLANRRGCEKAIASEISRAKREQKPLSCILIDVDRFKQVNDTYGHPAGDQILRELSGILRRSVRAYDIVSRWGGEEFLLVLPGADLAAARALAERIRVAVETLPTHNIGGGITISAGIATFDEDYNFDATLRVADRRLYQAKAAGRNCVI
jgi:diguanylate cyclase (GGDEF)-like protein